MSYQVIHTIFSSLGVVFNAFMMFLALTKSPPIMRLCSVVITIKTATDIMTSLINAFVMMRIVTDGTHVFLIPSGPCTYFGPVACYAGHMFMTCFLEHNLIWMICSYIFRYYILYVRDPKARTLFLTAFCLSIPSFFHMTTWISFFNLKTNTIAPEELGLDDAPNIILTGSLIYYSTITVFVQLAITAFLVLLTYIWLRDVLLNYSLRMGAVTSDTKKLNRVLVKIITFQVFLPIFIFTGVTIFALQYTGWVQQEYLDYMISLVFMCSPIMSPFSYMLFVPHYRNFFAIKRERTDSLALEHRRDSRMKKTVVSITKGTFAN